MMNNKTKVHVCPVEVAGILDNPLRKLVQNPKKILKPYIKQGMTVVDLGCGPGYFTLEMAKLLNDSGEVIAADLQEGMLTKIRQKIKGTSFEKIIKLHKCGEHCTDLTVKADFILAFYMIHEIPDQIRLFRELKSILKTDGKLLIIEPKFHVNRKAFEVMTENIESTGFKPTGRPKVFFSRAVVMMHEGIVSHFA